MMLYSTVFTAFTACAACVAAVPILRRQTAAPTSSLDIATGSKICIGANCDIFGLVLSVDTQANGDLVVTIDQSDPVRSPNPTPNSNNATVDSTIQATASGPNGPTGQISGGSSLSASLNGGDRSASSTLVASIGPDSASTMASAEVQDDGTGKVTAGGHVVATSGGATSSAGAGVGSAEGKAGGGAGGGADLNGVGAGAGAGANIDSQGADNIVMAGISSGAGVEGAYAQAIAAAIAEGRYAYGVSESGAEDKSVYVITLALTEGDGSVSGAGAGAGPGPDGKGLDAGVNSSS